MLSILKLISSKTKIKFYKVLIYNILKLFNENNLIHNLINRQTVISQCLIYLQV